LDRNREIVGYELLYRDGGGASNAQNGGAAARGVLADAVTVFGISKLTGGKPAYMIFTRDLLLNDFARLADPREIVIEVPESVQLDEALSEKLRGLEKDGYTLVLENYTGDEKFGKLMPLFRAVKVDFHAAMMHKPPARTLPGNPELLAEKVETAEEFDRAVGLGFHMFQGCFFERPAQLSRRLPSLAASSYSRLMNELRKENVDFNVCCEVIGTDVVLAYLLLRQIQTARYCRGNLITGIRHALVMMGTEQLRRWLCLVMDRQSGAAHSDELAKRAYLWGRFIEKLMENARDAPDRREGFLLGMFSLLDQAMGAPMEELLRDLELKQEIKAALLGQEENDYAKFLQYAMIYEMQNERLLFPDIRLKIDQEKVTELYGQCAADADRTFSGAERLRE